MNGETETTMNENAEQSILIHTGNPDAACDCWACDPREDEEFVDYFEDQYDDAESGRGLRENNDE